MQSPNSTRLFLHFQPWVKETSQQQLAVFCSGSLTCFHRIRMADYIESFPPPRMQSSPGFLHFVIGDSNQNLHHACILAGGASISKVYLYCWWFRHPARKPPFGCINPCINNGGKLPTSTGDRQISEASTVLRHNVDIVTHKNSTSIATSSGLIVKWMKNLSSSHQMRHLVRHAWASLHETIVAVSWCCFGDLTGWGLELYLYVLHLILSSFASLTCHSS